MSAFYDRLAATAHSLLSRYGSTGTLAVRTAGAYDPATGEAALTDSNHTVTAAVFDMAGEFRDGVVVRESLQQIFMSTATSVPLPKAGDVVTWQGVAYTVLRPKDLAPAGQSVLYELVVYR